MFIEEEVKCLKDLHIKTENIFFNNQKYLMESSKVRNAIEKVKSEAEIQIKKNNIKSSNNELTAEANSELNSDLIKTLEVLRKMEKMVLSNNKELGEMSDILLSKNSIIEYPDALAKKNTSASPVK